MAKSKEVTESVDSVFDNSPKANPEADLVGTKIQALRFTRSITFPFGAFDEVRVGFSPIQRLALVATGIAIGHFGFIIALDRSKGQESLPPTLIVPWSEVQYAIPAAD